MNFFKQVVARWKAPTPEFWKGIQAKGAVLTGISVLVGGVQAQFPTYHIPEVVLTISTHCAVAGFLAFGLGKLACTDGSVPPIPPKL